MAGDWIKLEVVTPDKPEVFAIAERLGIDPDAALGKLIRVWIWADQQTIDGDATSVTDAQLERITNAPGFAQAMREAGWLSGVSGALMFPNFADHNGQTAKRRALTARRMAKSRGGMCAKSDAVSVTKSEQVRHLEKRREEKRKKKNATHSCPKPVAGDGSGPGDGPVYLVFPVVGSPEGWALAEAKVEEWEETYVGLDVRAELRKALQWNRDNPTRRKTARGILNHLSSWLSRAQDRRGGRGGGVGGAKGSPVDGWLDRFKANGEGDDDAG